MNEKIKKALHDEGVKISSDAVKTMQAANTDNKGATKILNDVKKSLTETVKKLDDISKVLQEG